MNKDLQNFVYGGLPNFEEYEGVFNDGENGYRGNEGIIVFSDNKIQIPKEKNKYEDGDVKVEAFLGRDKKSTEIFGCTNALIFLW